MRTADCSAKDLCLFKNIKNQLLQNHKNLTLIEFVHHGPHGSQSCETYLDTTSSSTQFNP